jgi:opacity protein-like surface antigen
MKNLLRSVVIAVVLFAAGQANAQISAGAGVVFGSDINNIGFSINGKYVINETWAAAPAFTFFLEKDYVSWSVLDLDVNYQLTNIDKLGSLYAIGGLNMTFWKIDFGDEFEDVWGFGVNETGSDIGVNLGLGLDVPLTEQLVLAPELRYTLGGANFFRAGVKLLYAF